MKRLPDTLFLCVFAIVLLAAPACRRVQVEDISLPYSQKKYEPDSNQTCRPPKELQFFWWLQDSSFAKDRDLWLEKQFEASQRYLSALLLRDDDEVSEVLNFQDSAVCNASDVLHEIIPAVWEEKNDTLPLHLYYHGLSFENGLNPVVFMLYHPMLEHYLKPPASFFEKGGMLAVLGDIRHVVVRDSSLFFRKADSLARWIWRDTANAAQHRRNYRLFKYDSLSVAKHLKVTEKDIAPVFAPQHIVYAAQRLIAGMYTTPSKMALLSIEDGFSVAEQVLVSHGDLFRAAVLHTMQDSVQSLADTLSVKLCEVKNSALLMQDRPNRRMWAASVQTRAGRKTGDSPFLMVDTLMPQDAWKFMLYHITKEEKLVKTE